MIQLAINQIKNEILPPVAAFIKAFWASISGTTATWVAAITARQEQAEFWLKQVSTLAAISVSLLTAAHIIKNWNKK